MKHAIRETVRFLIANPGFAIVVVLTLGLAIGVNSTIFSVLNGVLLRQAHVPTRGRRSGLVRRSSRRSTGVVAK